jgi:Cd2+/Zn2+-exporting ATPase
MTETDETGRGLQETGQSSDGDERRQIELRVGGVDCEHDAAALRRGMEGYAGVDTLEVRSASGRVTMRFDTAVTSPERIQARLREIGFPPREGLAPAGPPPPWRNPKVVTSALSGALLVAGWLGGLAGLPPSVSIALYVLAMAIGGYFFGREALEDLVRERTVGIELLMSVAAVVAAAMGQAGEGAMLVFLYSMSEAAEGYTGEKTRSAVRALMKLAPRTAVVRRDGTEVEVPVEELSPGDVFVVRPGQSVATDGLIETGSTSVNEAPVTGESMPVEKQPGDQVLAGTLNGPGALGVQATRTFADNTLSRIIRMVEEAQERKGKSQRFVERFGKRYSPSVLAIGAAVALVPPLAAAAPWGEWITRATVFIVAAAPCALVISIPVTLVAALGTAARRGVLIKGGVHLEQLARVRIVALDKTGTLTRGEPEVTDVLLARELPEPVRSEADLFAVAAGIERWSEHPLARAIVRAATDRGIEPRPTTDFQARVGAGASARLGGEVVHVGSPALFEGDLGLSLTGLETSLAALEEEGKTVVVVAWGGRVLGAIALRDNLRPEAKRAVEALKGLGIARVVMLTGDNERTARAIAAEAGIDEVHARLKPEDKVAIVGDLGRAHGPTVMVGDGVNDAPALAAATVGVAMGAAGTDVALETADVALMADDLEKLVYALGLARRNDRIVRENLALSALVIGGLVLGAVTGMVSLPVAVIGHEVSEFAVIANGLRMLRA